MEDFEKSEKFTVINSMINWFAIKISVFTMILFWRCDKISKITMQIYTRLDPTNLVKRGIKVKIWEMYVNVAEHVRVNFILNVSVRFHDGPASISIRK